MLTFLNPVNTVPSAVPNVTFRVTKNCVTKLRLLALQLKLSFTFTNVELHLFFEAGF